MVKRLVSLMPAFVPILLLSACGDSGSSNNGAIVTNEAVLAMDVDDLSMKIKFCITDNTALKQPIMTDAYTFRLMR